MIKLRYFLGQLLASLVLLVFLPVILIVVLLSVIQLGFPVFFLQKRVGKDERIFSIVKFRTMRLPNGKDDSDQARLTPYGQFLRKYSLDELPQLINVLKGDMCIIGPRPLLPEYLELYNATQKRRHEVRPGITGWAQVNGRNAISWQEKFALDVWYVDNQSFMLDFKIFLKTVKKVFVSEGISAADSVTMEKFKGN